MEDLISSPRMFKDFLESSVWKDIKRELEGLLEITDFALRKEKDPPEFYTWQGRASALEDITIMIEGFAEESEETVEKELDIEDNEDDFNELSNSGGDENG